MSKKIIALLLAGLLACTVFASCGPKTPADTGDNNDTPAVTVTVAELKDAVLGAYGDLYSPESEMGLPLMDIPSDILESTFGVEAAWVEEFAAGMPMMITNVDTYIIVKPTEGNTENVLTALESYYEYLVNDSFQYPKDLEKVRAAKVFEKNGYVFFIMLGMLSDEALYAEGTAEEIATIQYNEAEANNQKAIDAIKAAFGE